jgi:hypothetical protein
MNQPKDYIKIPKNQITRPVASIYEVSHVLSNLATAVFNSPDLSNYVISNGVINDFVNPGELATHLIVEGKYDAWLKRDNEKIKYSDLYVNPIHYELLVNYFNKQHKITHDYVLSKYVNK